MYIAIHDVNPAADQWYEQQQHGVSHVSDMQKGMLCLLLYHRWQLRQTQGASVGNNGCMCHDSVLKLTLSLLIYAVEQKLTHTMKLNVKLLSSQGYCAGRSQSTICGT
jgi:hypothetical protein